MAEAFICDAVRTPIGRYGGALSGVRTDDLAAVPIRALIERNASIDWSGVDDVIFGCANQAGEDNRNVARMSALLAGLPDDVPGVDRQPLVRFGHGRGRPAARAIKSGEAALMIAGGVESMTRAPFVMGKATSAFSRTAEIYDTTIGWRFVNPLMKKAYGVDSMPETAENVAADYRDLAAPTRTRSLYRSQKRASARRRTARFAEEIVPVTIAEKGRDRHRSASTSIRAPKRRSKRWPD